jgi:DNA polymerase V
MEFEPEKDLHKLLIPNPISTFYGRIKGDSMYKAGVDDGDIIMIDKSLEYQEGDLAVCWYKDGFLLKRVEESNGKTWLVSANPKYPPLEVTGDFKIWGIVIWVIKKVY